MKQLKIWGILMLVVMLMPLVTSCGGDDDSDDHSLSFTKEMIVNENSFWDIKEITGNNSHFKKGASAKFYADGTCNGFDNMETSYEIKGGKLYTYYAKTKEPMFVYTLQSRYVNEYADELTVKIEGTLDDHSTCTIIMRKNDVPVPAH